MYALYVYMLCRYAEQTSFDFNAFKTHLRTSIQKHACITYKILQFMHKSTQVGSYAVCRQNV